MINNQPCSPFRGLRGIYFKHMKINLIIATCLLLLNTIVQVNSQNVVILQSKFTDTEELDSLSAILKRNGNNIKTVDIKNLNAASLSKVSVVIYHRSDSAETTAQEIGLKKYFYRI